MSDIEATRISELINRKKRRLHELQLKETDTGITTDPHITMEIQDLQGEITKLENQLASNLSTLAHSTISSANLLLSPLAKYDDFFRRLFEKKDRWYQDPKHFREATLASLTYATKSTNAFVVRQRDNHWEVFIGRDSESVENAKNLLSNNSQINRLIEQATRYFKNTKAVNPDIYRNVFSVKLQPEGKLLVLSVIPKRGSSEVLVLFDLQLDFEIDSAFSTIINALLQNTFIPSIHKNPHLVEISIYNALRRQFRYVSDYVYEQQFSLFKERLNCMTVQFEPIIELSRMPYIWHWEALARDPETNSSKAPTDLFETASLWGRQFQLELDLHFLRMSLEKYTQLPQGIDEARRQIARRSELLPLHVNVYPETLVRRTYREAVIEIENDTKFPLSKLILEISEKSPLPALEDQDSQGDDIQWYRNQLKHFTDRGISIALDDFGVGYASTSRLSRIEPEYVKIDRDALLHHLGGFTLEYGRMIVSESLGKMKMIIEGFDDQSKFTLAQLFRLNIRYVQGHLLGKSDDHVYRLTQDDEDRISALLLE